VLQKFCAKDQGSGQLLPRFVASRFHFSKAHFQAWEIDPVSATSITFIGALQHHFSTDIPKFTTTALLKMYQIAFMSSERFNLPYDDTPCSTLY
jgi:hypothetical protein